MDRETVEQVLEKTRTKTEKLPAEMAAEKALRTSLLELINFCQEATTQIDAAKFTHKPIRAKSLASALQDVRRDGSVLGQILCLDPCHEDLQYDLTESVDVFTKFVKNSLIDLPVLLPIRSSDVAIS